MKILIEIDIAGGRWDIPKARRVAEMAFGIISQQPDATLSPNFHGVEHVMSLGLGDVGGFVITAGTIDWNTVLRGVSPLGAMRP